MYAGHRRITTIAYMSVNFNFIVEAYISVHCVQKYPGVCALRKFASESVSYIDNTHMYVNSKTLEYYTKVDPSRMIKITK